ncbi:hypothetical protein H5410_029099 [Solanum commersonii]|uniref:Uncharacterized protein n=1 Tax=Solanum commersonii TaxID=4109 RepID=A0A9J5Z6T1_SOLCO|nr:hypothetical protein H5410_029099 [Solanum commersonii]
MLERDFTLSNGEITRSVFPPQQSFQINKNDKIVNFNAFSKLLENDTALVTVQHVNAIIKQNNYANIYMSILGEHIMSLHEKVDRLLTLLPTKVKGKEKVTHSSLQPPPDIEDFKIKDYSDLERFLKRNSKISEKYARKPVQRMFYYPRPTPQDVLLEEHEHIITNSYNGKEIYEWNIDVVLVLEDNFNAFSKLFENDTALITAQHVNVMIKQNNYANIYMSILGEHVVSLYEKVDKLISLLPNKVKGKEKVAHSSLQPPPDIEDFKIKDYSDLEHFLEKKFKGGGVQPIDADNFIKGEPSNKKDFYDNLNKISEK